MKTGFGSVRVLPTIGALVAAALLVPTPGGAADFFPLVSGTKWEFGRLLGEQATVEVFGAFDLLGQPTTRVRWTLPDQVFENFWTRDPQGHLFLHGARNLTFPIETAYTPQLLFLNPPMSEGQTWTTPGVVISEFDGSNPLAPFDFVYGAGYVGPLSVPAGTFDAVGVGSALPTAAKLQAGETTYDALGRRGPASELAGSGIEPEYWFSDGLGLLQFQSDTADPFRLLRFSAPTPVTTTTWTRIKALSTP